MRTAEVASECSTSDIRARKWAAENGVAKDMYGYVWVSTDVERFKNRNTVRGPKKGGK